MERSHFFSITGSPEWNFNLVAISMRLLGDELYAGVATDLMGRDFTIFRSMGRRPSIRTEQHDSRWLNGPCVTSCCLSHVKSPLHRKSDTDPPPVPSRTKVYRLFLGPGERKPRWRQGVFLLPWDGGGGPGAGEVHLLAHRPALQGESRRLPLWHRHGIQQGLNLGSFVFSIRMTWAASEVWWTNGRHSWRLAWSARFQGPTAATRTLTSCVSSAPRQIWMPVKAPGTIWHQAHAVSRPYGHLKKSE